MVTPLVHYCSCLQGGSESGMGGGGKGVDFVLIIAALITVCDSSESAANPRTRRDRTHKNITIRHRDSHTHIKPHHITHKHCRKS